MRELSITSREFTYLPLNVKLIARVKMSVANGVSRLVNASKSRMFLASHVIVALTKMLDQIFLSDQI